MGRKSRLREQEISAAGTPERRKEVPAAGAGDFGCRNPEAQEGSPGCGSRRFRLPNPGAQAGSPGCGSKEISAAGTPGRLQTVPEETAEFSTVQRLSAVCRSRKGRRRRVRPAGREISCNWKRVPRTPKRKRQSAEGGNHEK